MAVGKKQSATLVKNLIRKYLSLENTKDRYVAFSNPQKLLLST